MLAFSAVWTVHWAKKASEEKSEKFKPFWIRISPKWEPLFVDHGLVDNAGWEELGAKNRALGPGWNVMRDGIGITVLGNDLYYSNDHHYFFSEIAIFAEIPELRPAEKPPFRLRDFVPHYYVKDRFDYEEHRH